MLYLGLLLHAKTQKRGLIDKLYDLGLCVSYDRILAISTAMGNSMSARFEDENVVCPPKLRFVVFTIAVVHNIDHNPSSTTAKGSLHGTGISLFQHPSENSTGEDRGVVILDETVETKKLTPLPDQYSNVPPSVLPSREPVLPEKKGELKSNCQLIPLALEKEEKWLNHIKDELEKENTADMKLSWVAYHASQLEQNEQSIPDITSLLPLFKEEVKSAAMICHSFNVVKNAVRHLNPGQIPTTAFVQPLYVLAKLIQWYWPDAYGEDKALVMFGGLHVEMTALKAIGKWLEGSGWTSALVQANVASPGTANSFLKATHVSRMMHAHQVTASTLNILMYNAYQEYCERLDEGDDLLEFKAWCLMREAECPQFQYWSITLQFELTILTFVKSLVNEISDYT